MARCETGGRGFSAKNQSEEPVKAGDGGADGGLLAACASMPNGGKAPLTEPNETYIQVSERNDLWCYTRVIEGIPRDEICQHGDFIRYSPEPHPLNIYRPIPPYILALFGTMSTLNAEEMKSAYRPTSHSLSSDQLAQFPF